MPPTENGETKGRDSGGSFDERLESALHRQGQQTGRPDSSGGSAEQGPSALSIGLRVSVELASSLAVGTFIGWWLDKWFHTSPVLLFLFVLVGGAAGVLNVWRLVGGKDGSPGETIELTGRSREGPEDRRK